MNRFTLFVRTMAPGWFAAVMGTAVTSLALTLFSKTFAWAALPAEIFHWAAVVMMTVLGAAAVLRLVFFPKAVLHTVSHPVEGAFYATFPIALLVMAAEWTVRAESLTVVAWLWWPGVVGTFLSSFVILSLLFAGKSLTLDQVTPGHFIPAVGLVVIPVAGAGLAAPAEGLMREVYFGVNMVGFGAGVFMYVGLTALTMARHFLGAPIVGKMTPTLWVHLAPLAVIPLSMLALLHAVADASLIRYGTLVASAFMGAALWWMVIAAVLTVKNLREGKLPFAISWWAFVFPVGVRLPRGRFDGARTPALRDDGVGAFAVGGGGVGCSSRLLLDGRGRGDDSGFAERVDFESAGGEEADGGGGPAARGRGGGECRARRVGEVLSLEVREAP